MRTWRPSLTAWFISALLAGCGGGDSGSASTSTSTPAPPTTPVDPGAPTLTGNTATDGFNWFNYRRAQLGLSPLTRNSLIDAAARILDEMATFESAGVAGDPNEADSDLRR